MAFRDFYDGRLDYVQDDGKNHMRRENVNQPIGGLLEEWAQEVAV